MVPPFKEAVEACFAEGLVKVVFATETLALGINMPARSVVIEQLTKFTGERHEFLTPGEYTQLTGRAGRRGIDDRRLRHRAVVAVRALRPGGGAGGQPNASACARAFRPTYNMAANLVRRYDAGEAHHLLNLSFAQYQADRAVVRLETRLERAAGAARTRSSARPPATGATSRSTANCVRRTARPGRPPPTPGRSSTPCRGSARRRRRGRPARRLAVLRWPIARAAR